MTERPIGTVLQFGYEESDLPALLRAVAKRIEQLGAGVRILDVALRPDRLSADVYFLRVD
jgi:hypothetical protein